MNFLKFSCVILAVLLGGCYRSTSFDSVVTIRPGVKGFAYEIQIKSHGEGRGNPHDLFDWKVQKWDSSYWLYVHKMEGAVPASDLVYTPYWRCVESPRPNIKGSVEFQPGKVIVALDFPRYGGGRASYDRVKQEWESHDELIGYAPFEGNGTYAIREVSEAWEPASKQEARRFEAEAAPCNR